MEKELSKVITDAAKIELDSQIRHNKKHYKSIKYREELGVSKNTLINPIFTHYVVDLDEKPVYRETFIPHTQNIRSTMGRYAIRFLPHASKRRYGANNSYAFQIMQDLVHSKITVRNYNHWLYLCKHIPELDWLNRNSTLTRGLFDLAAHHQGICFPFTIDYEKYVAKLRAIDPNIDRPFVNYMCSMKDYNEKYKQLELVEEPSKSDIIGKIDEANKEYEQEYPEELDDCK